MSGTHVYYNTVLLRDCETIENSDLMEYDPTGTYPMYLKKRITIASTLISIYVKGASQPLTPTQQHPSTIRIPPISSDETMVGRMEEIEILLSEPRKDFWIALNGASFGNPTSVPKENNDVGSSYRVTFVSTGIIPSPTATSDAETKIQMFDNSLSINRVNVLDANNGPKPMAIDVKKITGGQLIRVQVTFELCRVLSKPITTETHNTDPGYDAQNVRGVICNTWGVVDSLDDDGAVTHTVSGKMVVKDQRYKVNAMRLFSFPLAFPFARLTNHTFTVDETGLVLKYDFQFKHAGAAPPQGIRKYEATYNELVHRGKEPLQAASMIIKVMGWHHRSNDNPAVVTTERSQKLILLRGAYTILWSRIRGINKLWKPIPGQLGTNTHLVQARVVERVGLPQLELHVDVSYTGDNTANTEFHNRMKNLGNPIDIPAYDPRWWPIDNEWGRLPEKDSENPNFQNAAYPYATSGDPTKSDYFTGYYQHPGINRHTLPRITGVTKADQDTSKEWAWPGGYVPGSAVESPSDPPPIVNTKNPLTIPTFSAIPSKNLSGVIKLGDLPPESNANYSGISDIQESGFAYLTWDSEIMHDTNDGVIMLPLSTPRDIPESKFASLGVTSTNKSGKECSVPIRLHAAISQRVYSVSSTRTGKYPEIPTPKKQIVRTSVTGSSTIVACVETLMKKELLSEVPKLMADQCTREFTLHARYTYGMSNPWAGDSNEGGGSFEILPVGESPIDKAYAFQNSITIYGTSGVGVETRPALFDTQTNFAEDQTDAHARRPKFA